MRPESRAKDYIITEILVKCAVPLHDVQKREYYKRTLSLFPKDADSLHIKGSVLHDNLGEPEEAIKCYDMALKISPENTGVQKSKAMALKEIQKNNKNQYL